MNYVKPNFLIVGAAKSGTTSLYRYLSRHPQVFLSAIKEPLYFVSEIIDRQTVDPWMQTVQRNHPDGQAHISDPDTYYRMFEGAEGCRAIGEASATYLYYFRHAIPRIVEELGDVKIVIILRDPLKKAISQYRFLQRKGHEPLPLRQALEQEAERMAADYCSLYQYVGQGLYYEQVKAYLDRFSQVKIFLQEDLKTAPQEVMSELFQFLGLADMEFEEFERHNQTVFAPQNARLHQLLNAQPIKALRKNVFESVAPGLVGKLKTAYLAKNEAGKAFNDEIKTHLIRTFRADTHQLERLIGKDLKHWSTY